VNRRPAVTATIQHRFCYLASQSPRRAQLLQQIGVAFEPLLAHKSENAERLEEELIGELPDDYVRRVTLAKLHAARQRRQRRLLPDAPILVADTTVALGRRMLGKPVDADDASATLRALSGRSHRVLTAVAVSCGRENLLEVNVSRVRFAPLSESMIRRYVESGEPFGKAGSYAIQGTLAGWIEQLSGSHSGVMGLPLVETTRLLLRARVAMALS
jgi:septum formation protein